MGGGIGEVGRGSGKRGGRGKCGWYANSFK